MATGQNCLYPQSVIAGPSSCRWGVRETPARCGTDREFPPRRRLAEIKRRWDPDNRFRVNRNIAPG
ncbi:BBE domain-containing protein [Halomonas gemina]|uniref:BBE domain-containing protein n=1 Tax=Halomonas gemina TaxID=2945105 RepID=UPI003D353DA6